MYRFVKHYNACKSNFSKRNFRLLLIATLLLGTFLAGGCQRKTDPISQSGFYFNTVITVTLYDSTDTSLLDGCMELAGKYENLFSNTIADSDISHINDANGSAVTVDDETIALLEKGLYYSKISDGKFDVTIGKLSSLWNFANNDSNIPADTDIAAALATVDYHAVIIDDNQVTLTNPDANIDLGGIAKGYIADKMKEYLNDNGCTSGIINLGGNVLAIGPKEDGTPYTIGIQKPFSEDGTAIASVQITDQTVVSSGVYERYFYVDDVLYHHILDTKTGYPYENDLLGVSIICENSVDGDGLSTTAFSLGLEDGIAFIESLPDTEAIFITSDYTLHKTSGIGTTIPFKSLE